MRGQTTFADRRDFENALALFTDAVSRFGIEIHAYCFLSNHYHLLIYDSEGRLSEAMHWFGTLYVRRFNRRYQLRNAVFAGRFWSDPIESDERAQTTLVYIERNALALVGPDHLATYPWSSFAAFAGERDAELLSFGAFETYFGGSADRLHNSIHLPPTTQIPLPPWSEPAVPNSTIETVLAVVATIYRCYVADVIDSRNPKHRTAREAFVLLLSDERTDPVREILALLPFSSEASVRSAQSRARNRLRQDPGFESNVTLARALLRTRMITKAA